MSTWLNLLQPENDAEAQALQSLLKEHGIETRITSFHDTAYDGLYQNQYGWGVLRVKQEDFKKAEQLVQEWRDSTPDELPWTDATK